MARILVLDPIEELRRECVTALRSDGHEVLEGESARAAVVLVTHQAFDLVVTELLMPDMDGLELIHRLRDLRGAPRVVATTHPGAVDPQLYLRIAEGFGAAGTMLKPAPAQIWIRLVRDLLVTEPAGL
jgi:CheY-like chemotaxis protein